MAFIMLSCNKSEVITSSENEGDNNLQRNEATWISKGDQSKLWWFRIKFLIGHTATDCGNKCVKIFGEFGHIDCMGFGNICNRSVTATLVQEGGCFKLVLDDPDGLGEDLDFSMPDRSLYITNPLNSTDLWLNIPEQTLLRDNNGVPFEILDIWFSEEPELENK